MTTRITAGAFLVSGNNVLLIKRGLHKKLAPGLWAGVGGHMELNEIIDPRALNLMETCYREVQEETGITKSDIKNLKLRYIVIRKLGTDIRFHHFFMGEVKTKMPLPECEEGELHWVDMNDVCDLHMSESVKPVVKHWAANLDSDEIFMIAINKTCDKATISTL